MDIVPLNGEGNQFVTIRDCGRAGGLVCGADWKEFTDWPHYEIRG